MIRSNTPQSNEQKIEVDPRQVRRGIVYYGTVGMMESARAQYPQHNEPVQPAPKTYADTHEFGLPSSPVADQAAQQKTVVAAFTEMSGQARAIAAGSEAVNAAYEPQE